MTIPLFVRVDKHPVICIIIYIYTKYIQDPPNLLSTFYYFHLCGTPWSTSVCFCCYRSLFIFIYRRTDSAGVVLFFSSSIYAFFQIIFWIPAFTTNNNLWVSPLYAMFSQSIPYCSMAYAIFFYYLLFTYVTCDRSQWPSWELQTKFSWISWWYAQMISFLALSVIFIIGE